MKQDNPIRGDLHRDNALTGNWLDGYEKKSIAALLLLVFLMYAPFVGKGFITDDFVHVSHVDKIENAEHLLLSPGPFRLYRPVMETSFYLNYLISGFSPFGYLFTNLFFHLLVILLLYRFVSLLCGDWRIGFFSALAFALTPKAHSIAVNWVSGRTDLLMSVFALAALIYWVKWEQSGKKGFFVMTALFYLLSILSKESSALLPVLMFFTTPGMKIFAKWSKGNRRRYSAFLLFGVTVLAILLRIQAGALGPKSADAHYNLMAPLKVIIENGFNYFGRSLPVIVLMGLLILLPLWLLGRKRKKANGAAGIWYMVFYGLAWFVVFIIPVSPIRMRSELYLYLPVAGFAVLGIFLIFKAVEGYGQHIKRLKRVLTAGAMVITLFSGTYIVTRNIQAARIASFSQEFMETFADKCKLNSKNTFIFLEPGNGETRDIIKRSLNGYFPVIVRMIYPGQDVDGAIAGLGDARERGKHSKQLRLVVIYDPETGSFSLNRD